MNPPSIPRRIYFLACRGILGVDIFVHTCYPGGIGSKQFCSRKKQHRVVLFLSPLDSWFHGTPF